MLHLSQIHHHSRVLATTALAELPAFRRGTRYLEVNVVVDLQEAAATMLPMVTPDIKARVVDSRLVSWASARQPGRSQSMALARKKANLPALRGLKLTG